MLKTLGLLTLGASTLAACSATSQQASSERMEMRAFDVPPETTRDVQRALRDSFSTGEKTYVGNVGIVAPGKLVVMAPAHLQDSIAASIKQIVKAPASGDGKTQQLRVQFWSVDAVSGKADDVVPKELEDALDQARVSLGDVHFVLRDQAGGLTATGREVTQTWLNPNPGSTPNDLRYTVSGSADALSMEFRYTDQTPVAESSIGKANNFAHAGLSITLPIKFGQTAILSQTPVTDVESAQRATRLYLVRTDSVK